MVCATGADICVECVGMCVKARVRIAALEASLSQMFGEGGGRARTGS